MNVCKQFLCLYLPQEPKVVSNVLPHLQACQLSSPSCLQWLHLCHDLSNGGIHSCLSLLQAQGQRHRVAGVEVVSGADA